MYEWLWSKLPFGLPGKIIGSLLLVTVVVWALWTQVFPRADGWLPFDDVQVSETGEPQEQPLPYSTVQRPEPSASRPSARRSFR